MIKDILQILFASTLLVVLLCALLRYVKPRRSQADFIIGLLNKLSELDHEEDKGICPTKKEF